MRIRCWCGNHDWAHRGPRESYVCPKCGASKEESIKAGQERGWLNENGHRIYDERGNRIPR